MLDDESLGIAIRPLDNARGATLQSRTSKARSAYPDF